MPQQVHLAISAQFHSLLVRTCSREQNKHVTSDQYTLTNNMYIHTQVYPISQMSCNKQFQLFEFRPNTLKVSQWNLHVALWP